MTADTTGVPDFAAWSRLLRGFADDIADGSGVSPEEILQVREIAEGIARMDVSREALAAQFLAAWFCGGGDWESDDAETMTSRAYLLADTVIAKKGTDTLRDLTTAVLAGMRSTEKGFTASPEAAHDIAAELAAREAKTP